ncbi:MAG: hypothetical protein ACU0B7_06690 [Paracoccaceae bacterium]|uniref:hypothetical protein n=1 Tax=Seohaeicola saemankumensis TaxID=481181 RepID=UPI001E306945|nr:hypothetical protein [Seohaeicola saemankumensis]MCD1624530.1 hypothetical protein [Seohaeicola saemankumensis]
MLRQLETPLRERQREPVGDQGFVQNIGFTATEVARAIALAICGLPLESRYASGAFVIR